MPISSALVIRFFQLLSNRRFAEAERELERIKQRMHKTEWNQGYSKALQGMLIARRSNNDQHAFFSKLDLNNKEALRDYRREFRDHVKSKLHEDFDRGFFAAWADCMRVLSKLVVNNPTAKNTKSGKKKGQARIESFLKGKA